MTPDGGRGAFRREAGRQKNPDATPRGMPEFVPWRMHWRARLSLRQKSVAVLHFFGREPVVSAKK